MTELLEAHKQAVIITIWCQSECLSLCTLVSGILLPAKMSGDSLHIIDKLVLTQN